ncbi:MAG: N(4)-(beta-N-acetylglucosaminyl)-L-asparaginase [Bacteroidota bacterium]
MSSRRKFLTKASLGAVASISSISSISCQANAADTNKSKTVIKKGPKFISTWGFGQKANKKAMNVLRNGGSVLDAVEQGVRVIEADENNSTVGYGGLPDREGKVTLDACIMDARGKCGSVCSLENIMHPVSVARMVMEKTPHVILVGEGAQSFALANGMEKRNLLTEQSRKRWEEWKVESNYKPIINVENHDTIGMIGLDENGDFAGACTTSGLAFKMRGRVGDSPIIGAGLYVDNEVGGAAATGLGEAILRTLGTFLIVEMMRQGYAPTAACKIAVERIMAKHENYQDFQVGFVAMNKKGESGGYSLHKGFQYAEISNEGSTVIDSSSFI